MDGRKTWFPTPQTLSSGENEEEVEDGFWDSHREQNGMGLIGGARESESVVTAPAIEPKADEIKQLLSVKQMFALQ